ncbi:UDP-N-acetylglucosamine acyltransferase [Agromyces sp. NPDC058484]|uniref:UDP-N-acetylglucosamine acyltransferase n=1 Tax=Agromyces sp. NPDC058484 TaxID=3346524 RepID=UPI00364CC6A8
MNAIHPTAVISGDVTLGSGNTIGPFAVITGPVVIGDGNWIGAGVVIGAPPEVRSFEHPRGDATAAVAASAGGGVRIGDRNVIREYAQLHSGWKAETVVGDDAFIMNQVYVAHDCAVDDGATLASSVLLAGHVHVAAGANIGLGTTVHQFRSIGRGAMIGMSSVVTRDVPAFAKAFGNPAAVRGANVIGMERSGVAAELVEALRRIYGGEHVDLDAVAGTIADAEMRAGVEEWMARRSQPGERA